MTLAAPFAKKISRRIFLQSLMQAPLALFLAGCAGIGGGESGPRAPGLGAQARRQNRIYGAAVQSWQLKDAQFAAALKREAAMLVPENELKWDAVHPAPGRFDFRGYRRLAGFAHANGMAMRGHCLVWHRSNPVWLKAALVRASRGEAEKIMEQHIRRVLHETAPMIRQWDVVNEAFDPQSERADGWRETLWLRALGPGYVPLAYRLAHEADPDLILVYNDYGLAYSDRGGHRKRQLVLRFLERCMRDNVPLHALGLQSHLDPSRPLAGDEFTGFLEQVRGMGYAVLVTELDLNLARLPGPMAGNITPAQHYVRVYLDMLQKTGAIDTLLTWGLSDRYTWLREYWPHIEGALPLDRNLNRAALWETLRAGWLG